MLGVAAALAVVLALGGGWWIGSGGLGAAATPPLTPVAYSTSGVPPTPLPSGVEATSAAPPGSPSPDVSASPSLDTSAPGEATPTLTLSPTAPPAAPTAAATAAPTPTRTTTPRPTDTPVPTATPQRPNLAILSWGMMVLHCGELGSLQVTIVNDGPVSTGRASHLRIVDSYGTHEAFSGEEDLPILAAGVTVERHIVLMINSGCEMAHTLTFRLDPYNEVTESNELDNVRLSSHVVGAAGTNLRVTEITLSTLAPRCGTTFTVNVTIANRGAVSARSDGLLKLEDLVGTGFGEVLWTRSRSFHVIAAHSSHVESFNLLHTVHCGETHRLRAWVNYDNRIPETDSGDNISVQDYVLNRTR